MTMKKKKTKTKTKKTAFCPYERKMVSYTNRGFMMVCSSCGERID